MKPFRRRVKDLVVKGGPGDGSGIDAASEAHGLHRGDGQNGLRQASVELSVPLDVGAQTRRGSMRDDLDDASHGVPFLGRAIDFFDHFLFELRIGAIEGRVLRDRDYLFPGNLGSIVRHLHRPHADDVASDLAVDVSQELLGHRAGGDPGRRFASAGPFQNVSEVVDTILQGAGEVGVAGTGVHELGASPRRFLVR